MTLPLSACPSLSLSLSLYLSVRVFIYVCHSPWLQIVQNHCRQTPNFYLLSIYLFISYSTMIFNIIITVVITITGVKMHSKPSP